MGRNCLIVLKDSQQRERLRQLVLDVKKDCVLWETDNLKDAYQILLENSIDVFFIDVVLDHEKKGDISGIRLARIVREMSCYIFTPIIFIGTLEDPEKILYNQCCCFDYYKMEYHDDDMKISIGKALEFKTPQTRRDTFVYRCEKELRFIEVKDVVYIECANQKMKIFLQQGQIVELPYMTCKSVLQNIGDSTLVQCARGVIVNSIYIRSVDKGNKLINLSIHQLSLGLGEKYYDDVLAQFCN